MRAVRLAYAAARLASGTRVWPSADVTTPSGWARRECERRAEEAPNEWPRILGRAAEWLLWREAAREAARDFPLPDPDLLADSLQRASALAAEYDLSPAAHAADSEAQLLASAQRIFAARCHDLGAASVSMLASRLAGSTPTPVPLARGFTALSPRLARLTAPARAPASAPASASASAPAGALATPRAVLSADADAQAEAIAAWCHERLAAHPDARLLVILPGEGGARERLASLIGASLDPGAVLGSAAADRSLVAREDNAPLSSLSLPAQALLCLTLLSGARLDPEVLGAWLNSPHWGAPAPGVAPRAALALALRELAPGSLNLREVLALLREVPRSLEIPARELDALLRRASLRLGDGLMTARAWSERFEAALVALGWPGPLTAGSVLHQTRLRWRDLLEAFGGLTPDIGSLRLELALELVQALAWRTPHGGTETDAAVTLSAALADPVVRYDGIWVASLSADVFPQPAAPDPFLPLHAQVAAGVPTSTVAGRRVEAEALLQAWRAGTPELVLSVPARDRDLEVLPSPALAGFPLTRSAAASLWLAQRLHRSGATEALEDARGTAFSRDAPLPSGTRALTLQNACPFRAYAELRLGATESERAEPGVPADARGRLLHLALQTLWERLRDSSALAALGSSELGELIGECVAQAARELQSEARGRARRRPRVAPGQSDLFAVLSPALTRECRRAERLIGALCELERTRAPFVVEATELQAELALGSGRVRMRLDRVDRIAGGRVVLDYKSGRPGSPDWYGERPTHPQLLAYLTALGADVAALATVNLTAREVRFKGVAAAPGLLPRVRALRAQAASATASPVTGAATTAAPAADWAAQQRSWAALIERLIRGFVSGDARIDPAQGACEYCHVTDICRIAAHAGPEVPGHADEADD
ncbi:MAG: PD-(D/E)XK nuclease family protein [Gammaproteobacteria bacterium]|nr:PD-(D/E)XK nuclease family protein [Gammaproteobacteria bacterium]